MFDYRTVGTMVDVTDEVDRIMTNLNRLQFDLQNKKAALSGELLRAHNIPPGMYDAFWPFSVACVDLYIIFTTAHEAQD